MTTVAMAAAEAAATGAKAAGPIVHVEPEVFFAIIKRMDEPLVLIARPSLWNGRQFRYLTSYKGLAFFTKTKTQLVLPPRAEVLAAKKIWVPEI